MFYQNDLNLPVFTRDINTPLWIKAILLEINNGVGLVLLREYNIVTVRGINDIKSRPPSHQGTKVIGLLE